MRGSVSPLLSFVPNGVTVKAFGWQDVVLDGVADDGHLTGVEAKRIDGDLEDARVGFAVAYSSRLDNLAEQAVEAEFAEHDGQIAVEIADQHQDVTGLQLGKNLDIMGSMLLR